jgi:WD40 repeat protein
VFGVTFSPDGKLLALINRDGTIRLWDVAQKKDSQVLKQTGGVYSLSFSPDGNVACRTDSLEPVGRDFGIYAQEDRSNPDSRTGAIIHELHALSLNGKLLITGGFDGTIRLWDVATRKQVGAHEIAVRQAVGHGPFARRQDLVTAHARDTLQLWNIPPAARSPR